MRKMCGFASSCACAKSYPCLSSPVIHSVISNDSGSRHRRPWLDCPPPPSEDIFSLGGDHLSLLSVPDNRRFWNCSGRTLWKIVDWSNIGIKHGFSCINIRHLPRDLANVYALKNHVRSLLLHKNWKHLLHFALFLALFCFAFSQMSRERNFHWLCSF